jgi:hypothetical protein
MKLTSHSFTWYTLVVTSAFFAMLSSTAAGTTADAAAARSMDSEGADPTGNVASSLRRLPTFNGEVTGFELYDVTRKPNKLWAKSDGTTSIGINKPYLGPNRPYSIKANVAGDGIGSVVMTLNNAPPAYENMAPYALCRDNYSNLDLISCGTSAYGNHVISAKACSGANGEGPCSALKTAKFQILPGFVESFDLIDVTAKPNTVWQKNLYETVVRGPSKPYSIRANTAVPGDSVGSVVMKLSNENGAPDYIKTENIAPYALCGDNGVGDFISCGMSQYGSYTIYGKVCSEANGGGFCGEWRPARFGISPA